MTLELIFNCSIAPGKIIALPRYKDFMKYSYASGKLEVYLDSEDKTRRSFRIDLWHVPRDARSVEFYEYKLDGCFRTLPVFYGSKGNVLKEGNR